MNVLDKTLFLINFLDNSLMPIHLPAQFVTFFCHLTSLHFFPILCFLLSTYKGHQLCHTWEAGGMQHFPNRKVELPYLLWQINRNGTLSNSTWLLFLHIDSIIKKECSERGMQTGIKKAHRETMTVCAASCTEGSMRRAMHPACRSTAQRSALGLCQDGRHSPRT